MKDYIHKVAVLITCHNRREKTLACLHSLFETSSPEVYNLEVFLVDDGSTDGTGEAVISNYSQVNVIQGNGNLFWNKGMRLAWNTASQKNKYDFYLWLNDDTLLFDFAILDLLNCYFEVSDDGRPAIICGACQFSLQIEQFSYGGKSDKGPVIPNGKLQQCDYINGNVVIVPNTIYNEIGMLSSDYTHTMGDYDYGLRAKKRGFNCYTTKGYVAICPTNKGIPGWCNPKVSIKKRWQLLHSPRGLNIKEYIIFRKKFWGWQWIIYAIKAYIKVIFPGLYSKISKN